MQTKPRLLVNLLAKLTRIEPLMGAMGGGSPSASSRGQGPGNTLGERLVRNPARPGIMRLLWDYWETIMARLLAILVILARLLWDYYETIETIGNVGNIGQTIGNIGDIGSTIGGDYWQ